jgi:hypothetical protein
MVFWAVMGEAYVQSHRVDLLCRTPRHDGRDSRAFYEATMHLPGTGVGEVKPSDQGHADSPGPGARAELLITIPAIYPLEAWDRCHLELPRQPR